MNKELLIPLEKLNQLALTEEEAARVLDVFGFMKAEEGRLSSVNTDELERMVWVLPMDNVLREDKMIKSFTRDELQEGAPEKTDGYWQVPRLVE